MVAKIIIPPNVPVNDLYATANMTASNALTTTNVFVTNVVATGQMTILGTRTVGKASLLVTGNVVVSNALVTGNVFTNTLVLNDTIQVTQGNIYVSNALVTTSVYVTGKVVSTASLINMYADGFSIVVPTGNAYVSNAVTTSNLVTTNITTGGNVVIHNTVSTRFTTLDVIGNAYVSNAVTVSNIATTNVYVAGTVTATATSDTGKLIMSVTGNAYVSNSISTNNVFAEGNVFASGTITVTGNAYVSNAVTTTNVLTTNVLAAGQLIITGAQTTGYTALNVGGNVAVSNAFVIPSTGLGVFAGNVVAAGTLTVTTVNASGVLALNVGGNVAASNALTTVDDVFTGNTIARGILTATNLGKTDKFTALTVGGNVAVSNALTTTNVFVGNVFAYGKISVEGRSEILSPALAVVSGTNTVTLSPGRYTFDLAGGQGGGSGSRGGKGMILRGVFTIASTTSIKYVVGAVGGTSSADGEGGGGGATYIYDLTNSRPLFVAGGGGGANSGGGSGGNAGTITLPGTGAGGIAGGGAFPGGGAGGGLFGDGQAGLTGGGASFLVSASPFGSGTSSGGGGNFGAGGGFGGGGGAGGSAYAGAGGGGYTGGNSNGNFSSGSGGTSYAIAGSGTVESATNTSGGYITIEFNTNLEVRVLDVYGNVYASNALVTSNISANMWSSNLTTSVTVTGNMYTRNNITTQNLFTTNVFASTSVQVNNTGLTVDPATGGIIVSTVSSSTQAQVYPPSAMTGSTLVIPGGGGTYTASASSVLTTQDPWKAFDGRNGFEDIDNIWKSGGGGYNAVGTGLYTGAVSTSGFQGEWLQLQVPAGIILAGYTITPYLGSTLEYTHHPRKWYILGSNDTSGWTLLDTRSGITSWTPNQGQTYSVSTATAFTYFRIVVNEIQTGTRANPVIGEWSLSGTMVSPLPVNARNLPVYVESGVTSTVFPPSAMSADTTVISGGTYVASASSIYNGTTFPPYFAFDKNAATFWYQQNAVAYSTTDGTYIGTVTTNFSTTVGGVPYFGEWLQLRLPTANVLSSYAITSRAGLGAQAPATFYIMGSNDDTTFTLIDTQTSVSWLVGGGETKTFTASSPYPFTRYRLIFNRITGSGSNGVTSIASWDLNCLSTLGYNIGDEYWNGTYLYKMMGANPTWRSIARPISLAPDISAEPVLVTSGGTETTPYSRFKLHTFTTSGTFTVSGKGTVEVLVVGGGGSGGSRHQGGGGAGGVVYVERYPISAGQYTVTVGTGGAANAGVPGTGTSGTNSVFGTITALGGGGGSIIMTTPGIFGCGGGQGPPGPPCTTITGTPGQGFPGGFGTFIGSQPSYGGGGGGGAGSAGRNADGTASVTAGVGGVGFMSNITGTNTFYAGGGGGGSATDSTLFGYGGLGGGGRGGGGGQTTGIAGTDGLGGGGGCGGFNGGTNYASGKGGNGVVIIKVPTTIDVVIQTLTVSDQIVIPIRQTRRVADVERVTWGLTGQPAPVYIDNQSNTGCNIVIPQGTYTSATSAATVTAKNSGGSASSITLPLTFRFSPPSYPGLVCWQDRSSWDATARTWADMSGAGNNGFNTSGTVTVQSNFITGTTLTYMSWPTLMPQTHTFFHVAKYNSGTLGTNTQRIFNGANINWVSGFWQSKSGVAYHYGWISVTNQHSLNWVLSTDQNYLYRSNGTQRNDTNNSGGDVPTVSNSPRGVTTNVGAYEPSDWAIAEIIVYNRTLSLTEILTVEAYLRAKYPAFSL